jgi:hypothetical protein
MKAYFGIIAGLCATITGCGNGSRDGLFLTESNAALGCRVPSSAPCSDGNGASSTSARDTSRGDAGTALCNDDDDCPNHEVCERQHGESRCQADHESRGPGSDPDDDTDRHGDGTDAGADSGCTDLRDCSHGDCEANEDECRDDDDRSGSNSGPH